MALKKPLMGAERANTACRVWTPDDLYGSAFPQVCEYLTSELWEDGSPRRTSTLLTFCEQGLVKICLSDRAFNRNTFMGGQTFAEAICALEEGLARDRVDWRCASRQDGGVKKGR